MGGITVAKNLWSVGGLYIEPGSKKGVGATFGVSSSKPDRIQVMMITPGVVRAMTISGNSEIIFSDIEKVSNCRSDNYNNGKYLSIKMKDGREHIINLKKEKKVNAAVVELEKILASTS